MSITSSVNSLSSAFLVGMTSWNVSSKATTTNPSISVANSPYRSQQWSSVGEGSNAKSDSLLKMLSNIAEDKTDASSKQTYTYGYFFDAFVRESHTGSVRITDHPVQGGANISDHAYNLPDQLQIEIFVSDVMDRIISEQFTSASTKSISAYETLRTLKENRQPLSILTRLRTYDNMIIESMSINEDYKSKDSLRCAISFRQIIMATVSTQTVQSTKEYATAENTGSQKSAGEPPSVMKSGVKRVIQ